MQGRKGILFITTVVVLATIIALAVTESIGGDYQFVNDLLPVNWAT